MSETPASETRREFLHAAGATVALGPVAAGAAGAAGIPLRPLGKTGVSVSSLALGGWHIGDVKNKTEAVAIMHAALDEGVTFFDNCWDYHDGGSEEVMGKALAADGGKWRKMCFLMTKVCARDGKTVRTQIEESLKRLKTDVIDLMQMHEINWDNDPEWVVEKGGLGELLKIQKEGKVRFVGYTGHKSPHIHLKMLAVHAWDTVQMPVNVCDAHYRSFVKQVLPEAKKRGTGVIGMKAMGGGKGQIVTSGVATAEECLRYALSQDVASVVSGIDSMDVLKKNVAVARAFKPLSAEETDTLLAKVKPHAGDGRHEKFKSTVEFDGPYHQKQHGFTPTPQ